jgi:hypothetical protein
VSLEISLFFVLTAKSLRFWGNVMVAQSRLHVFMFVLRTMLLVLYSLRRLDDIISRLPKGSGKEDGQVGLMAGKEVDCFLEPKAEAFEVQTLVPASLV